MSEVSLLGRSWNWSWGNLLMVDGQVCQTHQWVTLLILDILLGKEGVLFFRDGLDGIVQGDGGIWTLDGSLFNFNNFIFIFS